ncbi:hypothetical protein VNO78_05716 [Psophocarpus tetragonolobus]|uniref:Uncharacterized protein n=1 Tax=Psophocarpus tetragonolobus TaxID=3891 RepID=A0AAN9SU48_PSOTE
MKMRLVVIALTLLLVASSCMAISNKKTLVANMPGKKGEHNNFGNNDEHLNSYGDRNFHEIPGTGGPGQRTVNGHMDYTKPANPGRNG